MHVYIKLRLFTRFYYFPITRKYIMSHLSQNISLVQTEEKLIISRAMWDKYVVNKNIKWLKKFAKNTAILEFKGTQRDVLFKITSLDLFQ